MNFSDIYIRDPFVLPYDNTYYLYGKIAEDALEFVVYTSSDLENWSSPVVVFTPDKDFGEQKNFGRLRFTPIGGSSICLHHSKLKENAGERMSW